MKLLILFSVFLGYISCHKEATIGIVESHDALGNKAEMISIDLQKKDEDIKLIAQMRIHLIDGQVHLNGNALVHGIVNHVHMRLMIIEIEKGVKKTPELKPVRLRVLVSERATTKGKVLTVEEEFVQVEDYEVIQVDVKQVVFESLNGKPSFTIVSLKDSHIHAIPSHKDKHILFKDEHYHPSLPEHPLEGEDHYHCYEHEHDGDHHKHHHKHHHHHHHHKGFKKIKCWYHRLSWKSKFALFATGVLALITLCLFCTICSRKIRQRRNNVQVTAPMDDSVAVNMDDEKKDNKKDETYEFHFEFDNAVVVDDKAKLVE